MTDVCACSDEISLYIAVPYMMDIKEKIKKMVFHVSRDKKEIRKSLVFLYHAPVTR